MNDLLFVALFALIFLFLLLLTAFIAVCFISAWLWLNMKISNWAFRDLDRRNNKAP